MNIRFTDVDRMSANTYTNVNGAANSNINSPRVGGDNYSLDISSVVTDNKAYKGQGRTVKEVMMDASAMDIDAQRDYLTVMSNCVSAEDLAKMQAEGFVPGKTEIDDAVSIIDHIKAAVAKGGTNVIGYTDNISDEALVAITGSQTYANMLKEQFSENDIPLTEENVKAVDEAYDELKKVKPLTDAGVKYLIENDMPPSVENLYKATYAAGNSANFQGRGYYAVDQTGSYYAKKPANVDIEALMPQIKDIISEAGYEINDKTVSEATFLIEKGIPLTTDSLRRYESLEAVDTDMSYKEFVNHAVWAIGDGVDVKKADLSLQHSLREEAYSIYEEVNTEGSIKGRRVLEEVRLSMTVEANLKLLRSGFSIDTAPMEDLIKNLKEIEKEYAINLTHDEDEIEAIQKKNIFTEANDLIGLIGSAPISIINDFEAADTLRITADKAQNLKNAYDRASREYETLMTAPRADLGDSISKAFRNVDDILTGMDMVLTEENQRAVRILGYNEIAVTPENLNAVKEKDRLLTSTLDKMTPARVLGMIRDNINPLNMSVEELDKYLRDQDDTEEEMLSYSKFLYKLEKNKDITEDEAEAYIGIYRLINKIEKADHSFIGAIEELGANFNFDNILKAMRTRRKSMDYTVDDNFGGVDVVDKGIKSISSQIEKGFMNDIADLKNFIANLGNKYVDKEIASEEAEEFRETLQTETAVLERLKEMNMPVTAENIASMEEAMNDPAAVFKKLRQLGFRNQKSVKLENKESAKQSFREMTGSIKDFLKDKVFGEESIQDFKSKDIREMYDMYVHADFLQREAEEENYEIPVDLNDGQAVINLRIIHKGETPSAAISFETEAIGVVTAKFMVNEKGINGYLSSSKAEGVNLFKKNDEAIRSSLSSNGIKVDDLRMIQSSDANINSFIKNITKGREEDKGIISTENLYKASKAIIESVTEILK